MQINENYMRRALQLARRGLGNTSPNPMVGAVIVAPDGRIIGEGYHRRLGEAHAEVNAVRSVADKQLLHSSTIYVTLEPCSHYGKTPPCAKLLVDCKIPNVVIGAVDPFAQVCGRGIAMLREAGANVVAGVLENECKRLNVKFFTAHTQHRPFVMLKWAQSADGYIDGQRTSPDSSVKFSTQLSQVMMHRMRSHFDAILVGRGTLEADNPRLDCRLWDGRSPRPVVLIGSGGYEIDRYALSERSPIVVDGRPDIAQLLSMLYTEHGITSLLVEGGAHVLSSFIQAGIWDVARVETAQFALSNRGTVEAPFIDRQPIYTRRIGSNTVNYYSQNALVDVKNL